MEAISLVTTCHKNNMDSFQSFIKLLVGLWSLILVGPKLNLPLAKALIEIQ